MNVWQIDYDTYIVRYRRGNRFYTQRIYPYRDVYGPRNTISVNWTYVKVYEEERELTVMLLVDVSASRNFGAEGPEKREMIAEIAATIAFSAIQNNDKIGALFFSDRVEKFITPKKGRRHILFLIRELLDFQPQKIGRAHV